MGARYGAKRKQPYSVLKRVRGALDLSLLNLPDGITKPYRPKPQDFREVYIRIGWDGIAEHFGTNWRIIRRWIEMEGRAGLIAARAAYVEEQRRARRNRKLTAVTARMREG